MAAQQLQNEFTMSRLYDKDITCTFTETDRRIEPRGHSITKHTGGGGGAGSKV